MFGLEGRDTFNKPRTKIEIFFSMVRKKWQKIFPWIIVMLFVIEICFAGYVWYYYVYTKELSAEEKAVYVNQKKNEVTFKKDKFDEVKDLLIKRREKFDREREVYADIFYRR
jgi:hypothetical protein